MPQFTATVEAQHASELRAKRDMTDAQMAREYLNPPSAKTLRERREGDTRTRRHWIREAADRAFSSAAMDAYDLGVESLDDMTVTVTVRDLVATAVLNLPESN